MKKKVLITGATGFLGSNVLKRLLIYHKDYEVIVLKRALSDLFRIDNYQGNLIFYDLDKQNLREVFERHNIDLIIHCATNYGRTSKKTMDVIEANLLLPLRLLELAKEYKVNCFINTDTILDKGINYYTLSKSQFKQWLVRYAEDMICINMELEHFYGPLDNNSKFVTNIIQQLLLKVSEINLTKGEQKRGFVYIDDAVDAFEIVINNLDKYDKGFLNYQVAPKNPISIREFVELVKSITDNKNTVLNFGAIEYRKNEVMELNIDTSNLEALGWRAKVSLIDGIRKTVDIERNYLKI